MAAGLYVSVGKIREMNLEPLSSMLLNRETDV
jgi:hypothetical protein